MSPVITAAARARNWTGAVVAAASPLERQLARLALRAHRDDVPRQPELLEPADHDRRPGRSPAPQPVARRRRERMVVVVPRLAEREQREPEDVARLVRGREAAAAEDVADRLML